MNGNVGTAHVTHLLPGYAAGTLDAADRTGVGAHLAGCPACRAELTAWQVIQAAAREVYQHDPAADVDVLHQVWRRIDAATNSGQPFGVSTTSSTMPAPHAPATPAWRRFFSHPRVDRPSRHLATAALLLLTLLGSFLAFGPGRQERPRQDAAFLPAISGTPFTGVAGVSETLLDSSVAALPAGRMRVAVDRWRLQPSPAAVTLPAHDGVVMITVDFGEITVTGGGSERRLKAGDALELTNQEFAFWASGQEQTTAYVVYVTPGFSTEAGQSVGRLWKSGDPLVHAMDFVISSSVDELVGGSGRLALERITLPVGSSLPPQKASPLVWTEVGSGVLGLTLEGERLPFRWKAGQERKFFQFGREPLPLLAPGTVMKMRNAGEDPLVLYRLMITPREEEASGAAALTGWTATPSR